MPLNKETKPVINWVVTHLKLWTGTSLLNFIDRGGGGAVAFSISWL